MTTTSIITGTTVSSNIKR